MGWEVRKYKNRTCGPYFVWSNNGERQYLGREPTKGQVIAEYQRQAARKHAQLERQCLEVLDTQSKTLYQRVALLAAGCLVASNMYKHNGDSSWRKRRVVTECTIYGGIKEEDMIGKHQDTKRFLTWGWRRISRAKMVCLDIKRPCLPAAPRRVPPPGR